ncbi:MAG: DnaJ domain-containing protein [Spirochaetales bacterium]|nr:DnaJ domain-containing protein [Spirochaetales bacterium]
MAVKHFSATYIKSLKEAVIAAFWYKNDLKEFLSASLRNPSVVNSLDWKDREKRKREIVGDLFSLMAGDESNFAPDIYCLTRGILEMTSYPGLLKLEDAEKRLAKAVSTREALRSCVAEHRKNIEADKKSRDYNFLKAEYERRKKEDEERNRRRAADDELRKKNPAKYYGKILRLKGKVTRETVKERYREMIKLYHPDKFNNLDEEFIELAKSRSQQINEAYEYLKNKFGIH